MTRRRGHRGGGDRNGVHRVGLRIRVLLALASWPVWGVGVAADPKSVDPAADAELLEFLGSVDSGSDPQTADDGSWIDYLAKTDIGKVAKNARPDDAHKPADPDAGEKKND